MDIILVKRGKIGHGSLHFMIFSSPETLGSQGELIYHRAGVDPSVVHHFQRSSSLKPPGQSKPNFMWPSMGRGNQGHMTKMAAMPIHGRNLKKSSSPEPEVL